MSKEKIKGFIAGVLLTSITVSAVPTLAERVSKTAELFYNGIQVIIDGKRADLRDANGNTVEPFILDGTTYLPVRAVATSLNKAVSWDGATQTVYLGKNDEIQQPSQWLKDKETFSGNIHLYSADEVEFGGYEYNNYLTDNTGKVYKNSFYIKEPVSYLTNYQYSNFKGTFYLANHAKDFEHERRMLVYGDDQLLYTSDALTKESRPLDFDIKISNVGVLKVVYQFRYGEDSDWREYSDYNHYVMIGNAGLYE